MKATENTSGPKPSGFFAEFRRRRVLQVTGAYIAIAWLVTEIAGFFLEQTGAPPWSLRLLAIIFMVGFPITAILAWVIQVQPDGKRALDSSKGQYKTVIGAIGLGIAATAGLAWLILPRIDDVSVTPGYDPEPDSIMVLPFLNPLATPNEIQIGETLYTALTEGLNEAEDLTQIIVPSRQQPGDILAWGRKWNALTLLFGRIVHQSGSTQVEMSLLDVASGKLHWTRQFDWDPTQVGEMGSVMANDVLQAMGFAPMSAKKFSGTDNREAYGAFLEGARLAWTLFDNEGFEAAIPQFQKATDLDPGFLKAHLQLANVIDMRLMDGGPEGQEREALETLRAKALDAAEQIDSGSPDLISMLGMMELRKGNHEIADGLFKHALEIDPDHAQALTRYAFFLNETVRDPEKAENLWRRVIVLRPRRHTAYEELAVTLRMLGRKDESYAEMQKCIKLEPGFAESYAYLAFWEMEDGRPGQAILNARKAFALQMHGNLAGIIANLYAQMNAEAEALAWVEQALELSPRSLHVWRDIKSVFLFLGLAEQVSIQIDRAVELFPENQEWLSLSLARDIRIGEVDRALQRFEEVHPLVARQESPRVDQHSIGAVIQYARLLTETGENIKAQQLLARSLEFIEDYCDESLPRSDKDDRFWVCKVNRWEIHILLQQREKTLVGFRKLIEEAPWRWDRMSFLDLNFIKEDPEFLDILNIVADAQKANLEVVRGMERNGEIPPPPWAE